MFALLRRLVVAAALLLPAVALAQDFPPGWRELPQRPIVLQTGASLALRIAESPRAGAFLFVSAPLAADSLAAAWAATLDRALGQARVRQDLGVAPDARGERRTRVVAGRIVAGDGKPRAVLGEAQLVRTPAGGFIVGFLNAQDGADEPGVYEVAAQWVVTAAPQTRAAGAPQAPSAAQSGARPLPAPGELPPVPDRPQAKASPQGAPTHASSASRAPALSPRADAQRRVFPAPIGPLWMKAAFAGGNFDAFAKFDDKGLVVRQPAGANGGTGVMSTQAALRFEDLGEDAETTVTWRFDPAATTSVMLSLCPAHVHHCGSEPGLTVYWRRTKEGAGALIWTWASGAKKEAKTAASLDRLAVALTRKGARVEAAGATLEGGVDALRPHATFEIGAMAVTAVEGEPVDMALLSIDVAERHGAARPLGPAPGVEPLKIAPVFAGAASDAWKPLSASGGDFSAFARYADGGLVVDVPKQRSWATTGLASAAPVLRLPEESARAPALARVTVDPARSKSFAIALTREPTSDLWFRQTIWASYAARPDGSGRLTASFCASPGRVYGLDVPPGWDGRLEIEAAAGFGLVRLAPGHAVGAYLDCLTEGQAYHLNVVAQAETEHAPASMLLRRIEIGRVGPAGMTAMDRLELVEDEAFDPQAFLDVAAERLAAAQGAPR